LSKSVVGLNVVVGDVIDEDLGAQGVLEEVDDGMISCFLGLNRLVVELAVSIAVNGRHCSSRDLCNKSVL